MSISEYLHDQTTVPDFAREEQKPIPMPKKIGPYKIESLLNRGGMSYLYLATHDQTAHPLAIKVLSPRFLKQQEMLGRFLKEAQIIAMTNHPNIVRLYGQGQWEKGLYIAMEFIQGISLRQFIQQKSLNQKRALEIILQVAYALCHLHTHGVIHRDLKPENILITETGEIKVIDFGIAQLHREIANQRITQTRRFMGTPIYMSPEQKEDPLNVSYASDIYSLGIITYELVLGRLSHGVIQLSLLSKGLRVIIEKALKINANERYQDIVDFITDISQYTKNAEQKAEADDNERIDEVAQWLCETPDALFPKKTPKWQKTEIGIATQKGIGLYCDFFQLPDNLFAVVLAESLKKTIESVVSMATLRGMVRMSIHKIISERKKDFHPVTLIDGLNGALAHDPLKSLFSLSFLLLQPEKEQLSFISCNSSDLLHYPERTEKIRILSTPNTALGADASAIILETADNWHPGDRLYLFSKAIDSRKMQDALKQMQFYSIEHQPKKVFETLTNSDPSFSQKTGCILSIRYSY